LREVLEGLAARLAAERIQADELHRLHRHLDGAERHLASPDPCGYPAGEGDFHGTIARAARSPQLDAALAPIQARLRLLRRRSGAAAERARQALVEHRAILSAIERRDPDEAEVLMRAHIRMARANLLGRTGAPDPDGSRPDPAMPRPDPDGPDPIGAAR
jgi:DNA-binding GntR family transcriptional regulator